MLLRQSQTILRTFPPRAISYVGHKWPTPSCGHARERVALSLAYHIRAVYMVTMAQSLRQSDVPHPIVLSFHRYSDRLVYIVPRAFSKAHL